MSGQNMKRAQSHCWRKFSRSISTPAVDSAVFDRRSRLSRFWIPTGGIAATEGEDAQAKLIRAGFLRQSHAGIFHMLPLGQRVQQKLEALIDRFMAQTGASKVSLSSISSQALWRETNRLDGYGPELFRLTDRKDAPYLLAPTHEEEITTLVARTVSSYKNLPLRLYQISRKYRDEMRPRHGMLRSREFLMKDLYTFDSSLQSALKTYDEVRVAYKKFFDELKVPYLVAEASSGDIGGDLSHEYHLPTSVGEDFVVSCNNCDYTANEELATARPPAVTDQLSGEDLLTSFPPRITVWRGISKDRKTLVNVWYPAIVASASGGPLELGANDINIHVVKSAFPDLDSSIEDPMPFWTAAAEAKKPLHVINILDQRLSPDLHSIIRKHGADMAFAASYSKFLSSTEDGKTFNVLRIREGDACARCETGKLNVQKAIELGHTFHLGTRYSEPLKAYVKVPANEGDKSAASGGMVTVPMQMGCHGIGVSRVIGAVADHLADEKGLNWPRAIAPFEVVVVPGRGAEKDAEEVYDKLVSGTTEDHIALDVVLDDRSESFPWKMNDADLIGYPVIVLLGRSWSKERLVEVQCRRLSTKELVSLRDLPVYINTVLSQL